MTTPRFTLVTDGSSDGAMLIPILEWLLRVHFPDVGVDIAHANPPGRRSVPTSLKKKIEFALKSHPCDVLFIHRDAEKQPPEIRRGEIQKAVDALDAGTKVPHVCVIPIHMTEAWLVFDESAIRRASGNPNGKVSLTLPGVRKLEDEPKPKSLLHKLLIDASELEGRRRRTFEPEACVRRVARFLDDFSPLRGLSAFQALENEVKKIAHKVT